MWRERRELRGGELLAREGAEGRWDAVGRRIRGTGPWATREAGATEVKTRRYILYKNSYYVQDVARGFVGLAYTILSCVARARLAGRARASGGALRVWRARASRAS